MKKDISPDCKTSKKGRKVNLAWHWSPLKWNRKFENIIDFE